MANENTSRKQGLRPIEEPFGTIRVHYYKAVTGAAYYMHTPVDLDANGYVKWAAITVNTGGAQQMVGSIVGFLDGNWSPITEANNIGYVPANPTYVDSNGYVNVAVADDPNQLFMLEEGTGGTALAQTAVGAGASLALTSVSGSTISGMCSCYLNRSFVGITPESGLSLQIIKKWDKPDNVYGDYCKWIVRIRSHRYVPSVLGVTASDLV